MDSSDALCCCGLFSDAATSSLGMEKLATSPPLRLSILIVEKDVREEIIYLRTTVPSRTRGDSYQ
jgi:hypothetical protein